MYISKFVCSEKATKFLGNLHLTFSTVHTHKVEISENFVAFSEYMIFILFEIELNFEGWNIFNFFFNTDYGRVIGAIFKIFKKWQNGQMGE